MDVSNLHYPKKSHRKPIITPGESVKLAEFLGIEIGDGGISNPWQVIITMNAIADYDYSFYVTKLARELFSIVPYTRVRPRHALLLIFSSTTLIDFLVEKGAVRGNKIKQKIDIPRWIRGNQEYERAFVRGLVDTDGCLYIHKHTCLGKPYKNIGFCFASSSKNLLDSAADILAKNGITPHISKNGVCIYLYKEKSVVDYMRLFGSSNPRIWRKFNEWRGRIEA